ncbi:GTP binding protein [Aureococcus anophagefferens]|uniref:GTP binding protein n=1 Tax=Aureococcus anophagefferens TaxID=44056 RepID=A0ABR1FIB0_AURAN
MSRALLLLLACSLVRIDGFVAPPRPAPTIQLYAEDGPSRRGRRRARKERTHLTTPTEAAAPAAPAPKKAIPRPSVLDGIGTPSPKKLKQRTAQPPEAAAARAAAPRARAPRRPRAARVPSPRAAPPAFEIYDSAPDERAADAPEPAAAEAPDDSPAAFAAAAWDAEAGEARRGRSYVASCRAKLPYAAPCSRPRRRTSTAPRRSRARAEEFAWADGERLRGARDGVDAALAAAFRDAAAEAYARDAPRPPRPSRGPRRRTGGNLRRGSPVGRYYRAPWAESGGAWDRALVGETCAGAAPAETYDEGDGGAGVAAGAATAEHLNGAMVRSVDRGPTADAMARLPAGAARGRPPGAEQRRQELARENALLGARAAPTSPVPGRTRRFHFYDVNNGDGAESERPRFALVDVPGRWPPVAAALRRRAPAADAATLDAVAGSRAADAARHVLVLTKVDKLKPRELDRAEATLRAAADAAYAGDGGRAAVVRTAATARPPVGRADLWREILAGLDAAS